MVIRLFNPQKSAPNVGQTVVVTYLDKSQTDFQCRVSVSLLMALIRSSGYHTNQVISLINSFTQRKNGTTWCTL